VQSFRPAGIGLSQASHRFILQSVEVKVVKAVGVWSTTVIHDVRDCVTTGITDLSQPLLAFLLSSSKDQLSVFAEIVVPACRFCFLHGGSPISSSCTT
jgi:hypothetical protein